MTRLVLMAMSILLGSGVFGSVAAPPASAGSTPISSMSMVDACGSKQGQYKFSCYETVLLHSVKTAGVATAMDVLSVIGALDEDVQRDGHVYAHAIGITGFQSDPDVGKTFARCSE